jgi:hypothetical protein
MARRRVAKVRGPETTREGIPAILGPLYDEVVAVQAGDYVVPAGQAQWPDVFLLDVSRLS